MTTHLLAERWATSSSGSTPASRALAELFAAHSDIHPDQLLAELAKLRGVSPLQRIIDTWDLSLTDVARIFSVSRQAVSKWVVSGTPADRSPAIAELSAATDLLVRHLKADRIPAVVRRAASGLGNRSLLAIAESGDAAGVLTACRAMFAFETA